ncbi:uncharacterized protein LOC108736750 isoform X2 [Agrilus planipennis]|uniref:Uncharacterized protein LOC108736750 isoform X2 n=1 Tax=Agrilus planipennis TaxID=224129 RepID=A0A1W4WLM2_AGRPL|nr:uncharacterized protein LOC108736750 isoform X2 [Agrilus planipennis]XP_018324809.1 uncharacterized protein LOC108736750 isoform X2 [Agrilus planipennis]
MAYENFNMYSREGIKKPKVIVESVKSDTIYTPLWINDFCNNMELKKSIFSRYYLSDARLNSVLRMTDKELQDTTEIVMKFVNSLYGDSIAQQLGLTNNNSVNPEEALRKWNIKDYMAMGNAYPYNCVFNLMENAPLRSSDPRLVKLGFGNFSQNTFQTNTSSSTNSIGKNRTVDKVGYCHHLNVSKINKETQSTDKIPVKNENNYKGKPLVSLEVTTFANGKLAKMNCLNKTNESSIQKTKLFFTFTEYQKLLNVLHKIAAARTESASSQKPMDIIENRCNVCFNFNTNCNRNVNYTNNTVQTNYKGNVENTFAYTNTTETSKLICEKKNESMSHNQKYCMSTYTSPETKANVCRPNLTNVYPVNESKEKYKPSNHSDLLGCNERCPKTRITLSNQKSKPSHLYDYEGNKENLQQNKLFTKRVVSRPFQNCYEHNDFVECKDFDSFQLSMRQQINSKHNKKIAVTKKNKNLESEKNKIQSGSVQKKNKVLTTQSRNVQVIPLAPITTTTVKSQRTNKKKNCRDSKDSDINNIIGDEFLENTMDVIDWIEKNSDTLNTVQWCKSVKEIKNDLLKGIDEKENNNESENKPLTDKTGTKKKSYFNDNKRSTQTDEKANPDIKKENHENKILKENVTQPNNNTAQFSQISYEDKIVLGKNQIAIPSTEAEKNKNETEHENNSNKSNSICDQIKTTPKPEDGTEHQKSCDSAEGTDLLPNSNEDNNQKAYPYNLRKRKPVVYFYPSGTIQYFTYHVGNALLILVFRRIVPNRECKRAKTRNNNKKETN